MLDTLSDDDYVNVVYVSIQTANSLISSQIEINMAYIHIYLRLMQLSILARKFL